MSKRPAIPPPPYEGGCLCGAARYRLEARPFAINACYCDQCKKLSGATNLLMLLVPRASIHHLSGELARFRKTAESGRQADIARCAICGTRLWHEPLSLPDTIYVAAGTLDDSHWVVPASEIWTGKASPLAVFQDDTLKIEGQPTDRKVVMDAFARLYPEI